jgi:3-isopropylmalate/(R)-2-methylmalate dehydratase small subunit
MAKAFKFGNDIDTDAVIPAAYLVTIDPAELGAHAMEGSDQPDFAAAVAEGDVIVAGDNFGCGSSREHAPWALVDAGFQAVISTSFADIFHSNALKNSMLPISLETKDHQALVAALQADPGTAVSINLVEQTVSLSGGWKADFPIDAFSKQCLLEGIDQLGYLIELQPQILRYEAQYEK